MNKKEQKIINYIGYGLILLIILQVGFTIYQTYLLNDFHNQLNMYLNNLNNILKK